MPTINEYKNEDGYYIRARPSDAGNITYKIEEEGHPIIWKHGLRDDDEIAWSTIQSFKSLGIIYTEQSGTLGPDDFKPDPEQLEKTALSESDAEELFSIITRQFDLSAEKRTNIRSILGLPEEESVDFEAIGERVKSYLYQHIDDNNLLVRPGERITDPDDLVITTWVNDVETVDHGGSNLHIEIHTEEGGDIRTTEHCIHLCGKHGFEYWHIRTEETPTWDLKYIGAVQKSILLPVVIGELQDSQFELGDPAETVAPSIDQVSE